VAPRSAYHPDVRPGCGSLGGIYTAVVAGAGPVLCVAWDMPFLTEDFLRALATGAAGYDAYLPESDPKGLPTVAAAAAWSRCAPCTDPAADRRLSAGSSGASSRPSASTPT